MKRCGLVIRVSTDRQARNKEGSLKNQLQRLRKHIEYKNVACGENWVEAGKYILKGVSGKDSFRSPEFARLFSDIQLGKVNTVICTALDRICRSVKDFLNFFEILNQYDVEFVCLKQNYDTTSSQGKLFITIMMALAEFEREQTSERNREATLARAERGLWNGGHLLGYDLDPTRKGYLIINEREKHIVQFAFKKYLECGSLLTTARAMNNLGYRTKSYTSRRDKVHPPRKFVRSSVKHILMNYAYIGKKEINKKKKHLDQDKLKKYEQYRIVPAVWDSMIDEDSFVKVQHLLKENNATKHNAATKIRHTYILNSGLLWCDKCGHEMEGTCGTSRTGNTYYYYRCKNKDCRFKLPADQLEKIVLELIQKIVIHEQTAEEIIKSANENFIKELPQLKQQKKMLEKELVDVKNYADGIMKKWASVTSEYSNIILQEKLDELAKRRMQIEEGIRSLKMAIEEIKCDLLKKDEITGALNSFLEVFRQSKPYQQKDLIRLVLQKVFISDEIIKIALYGKYPDTGLFEKIVLEGCNEKKFTQTSNWLPGSTSERTTLRVESGLKINRNYSNQCSVTSSILVYCENNHSAETLLSA